MKCFPKLFVTIAVACTGAICLAIPPNVNDCDFNCTGSGGPCDGTSVHVEVDCGATRCHIVVKISGPAGDASSEQDQDKDSNNAITVCAGDPPNRCCVEVSPCFGSDWEDVGSSCAALCHECVGS